MAGAQQPNTEDIIAGLTARAKAEDLDSWRVKVFRRMGALALPELVMTLDGARVEHFAMPETWIPRLSGGGQYALFPYHAKEPSIGVGYPINVTIQGEPIQIDTSQVKAPDWPGPKKFIYPMETGKPSGYQVPSPGHGAFATPQSLPGSAVGPGMGVHAVEALTMQLQAANEARAALERRLLEEAHKADLARVRAEMTDAIRDIKAQLAQPHAAPVNPLSEILSPLLELGRTFLTASQDARKSAVEQSNAMTQRQMEFMQKLLDAKTAETPMTKVMTDLASSFAAISELQMEAVQRALDLGQTEKEPTGLRIVGELTKGLAALAAAGQAGQAPGGTPPTVLPIQRPMPQPAPQPLPAPAPVPIQPAAMIPVVAKFVALIKSRVDPRSVAQDFVQTANTDETLQRALAQVRNNPIDLFAPHLADWIHDPANVAYINALIGQLQQIISGQNENGSDGDDEEEDAAQVDHEEGAAAPQKRELPMQKAV